MSEFKSSDLRSISYFWFQKGDIERWDDWEKAKDEITRRHPEIIRAWENYKIAVATLNAVVKQAESLIDD